jgi:hypothetical protein
VDRVIRLKREPSEEEALRLYEDLCTYHEDFWPSIEFDEDRVIGWVGISAAHKRAVGILGLIYVLSDPKIGFKRLGRCEYKDCGKYFIGRPDQRFCPPEEEGVKSPCAVKYHIAMRSQANKKLKAQEQEKSSQK